MVFNTYVIIYHSSQSLHCQWAFLTCNFNLFQFLAWILSFQWAITPIQENFWWIYRNITSLLLKNSIYFSIQGSTCLTINSLCLSLSCLRSSLWSIYVWCSHLAFSCFTLGNFGAFTCPLPQRRIIILIYFIFQFCRLFRKFHLPLLFPHYFILLMVHYTLLSTLVFTYC